MQHAQHERRTMAVYVDNMQADFGRMKMSHMSADTTEELQAMAKAIGVRAKWIQYAGTYREHFDICKSKRTHALTLGAIPVTTRELVQRNLAKRTHGAA
jgi:uncharacterized protein DUF4031